MGDISQATYVPPPDYQTSPPYSQIVGASPFIFQNPVNGQAVQAFITPGNLGSISIIEYSKDGTTWYASGMISGAVILIPGDRIRITWLLVKPNLILSPLF